MLLGIALVYSLLCLRLRVQLEASFVNGRGSASFCVGALGVYLRRDSALAYANGFSIRALPRYGRISSKKKPERHGQLVRAYLIDVLRSKRFERIVLHLRLGLGDACETAVASGAVHALSSVLLAAAGDSLVCDLRVTPDFEKACLLAQLSGIFSCRLGDIIPAALRLARRNRKEGLKWTSIPLRA